MKGESIETRPGINTAARGVEEKLKKNWVIWLLVAVKVSYRASND